MQEILEIAKRKSSFRPMHVKVPESAKKYDRIYIAQERTKKILKMY